MMKKLLLIPQLDIQSANALSSYATIGFPAVTVWHGFLHLLERKANASGMRVSFGGFGVASHEFNVRRIKNGKYEFSVIGQVVHSNAKPTKDKPAPASLIELARCDLVASVFTEVTFEEDVDQEEFLSFVHRTVITTMRLAGGNIINAKAPELIENDSIGLSKLKRKLRNSNCLISRQDLVEGSENPLQTILDFCAIHNHYSEAESESGWHQNRATTGWIVPISVGFAGVSELKEPHLVKHARDSITKHRFVENALTLGEFIKPYRATHIEELLWRPDVNENTQSYIFRQNQDF